MLLDQVRVFCATHQLFPPGSTVIAAVSGGPDSLALLHLLIALSDDLKITVIAATLDHQIRGAASAADAQFVAEIARRWGVPIVRESVNVPEYAKNSQLGIEAAAREVRYSFLARTARKAGATAIAVGHNQDDQTETVLMHIIRGSGLAGFRGMSPKTTLGDLIGRWNDYPECSVVRPLLDTPRAEIDVYLRDLGVTPRIDATNADTHYTRNRLRHEIMPLLEKINPQIKAALSRTARIARDDYESLKNALPSLTRHNNVLQIDKATFLTLTQGLQRLLVREAVGQLTTDPDLALDFEHTDSAAHFAREHLGNLHLTGSIWLQVDRLKVSIYHRDYPVECPYMEAGGSIPAFSVTPNRVSLPGGKWGVAIGIPSVSYGIAPSLRTVLKIQKPAMIEVRTRQPGDRFRPEGSNGHSQKLSDTFINMKIPADWRDHVPLVIVNGEIAFFCAPLLDAPRPRRAETFAAKGLSDKDKHLAWLISFYPITAED